MAISSYKISRYKIKCVLVASQLNQAAKETLDTLKAQDYPDLEITVVDVSNSGAAEFEGCRVFKRGQKRRWGITRRDNFSAASNLILHNSPSPDSESVEQTSDFLLFLRNGVLLKPDALSRMVEEADNSVAGIVGAKLLIEGDEAHLAGVGIGMYKTGSPSMRAPYGELDQGQYDAPEEVFAVQKECILIRRDLFVSLGGFDRRVKDTLSDLDFCWRAHLAGEVVVLAPQAVASFNKGKSLEQFSYPGYRYQIRILLGCYRIFSLMWVLPQVFLIALFGLIWNLLTLSPKRSFYILEAWFWNLFNLISIFQKRIALHRVRKKSDKKIKSLQKKNYLSSAVFTRDSYPDFKEIVTGKRSWFVWPIIFIVLAFGSRHLFTQSVPVFGEFLEFDSHFLSDWFSSWRSSGLGTDELAPGAAFWLGLWHVVFLGADSLARTAFLLSPFVLGGLGMWRLMGEVSQKSGGKGLGTAAYMAVPLSYIAFRNGDLDSLVIFASAPWILSFLLAKKNFWLQGLVLSMIVGFSASFTLDVFGLLAVLTAGCLLAGILAGTINFRAFILGISGGLGAAALNLSWGVQFWEWRPGSAGNFELMDLLIFNIGDISASFLVWGMVGVAALALLVARGETSSWMIYAWVFYLGGVVLAWTAEQDLHRLANVEVLLQPAALGLAMAVGLGINAYIPKNARETFSWRKFSAGIAGLVLLAGTVPVLVLSLDGRWDIPKSDYESTLSSIDDSSQRVVWIGHPDILGPGSYQLKDTGTASSQLAFAVTLGATPTIIQKWAYPEKNEISNLSDELANIQNINRLGGRLALFGISHIILVERLAPLSLNSVPIDDGLKIRLDEQIDLKKINTREGISIYSNTEVIPVRALLPAGALNSSPLNSGLAAQVFQDSNKDELAGGDFYFIEASNNWNLTVEGKEIQPVQIYEWAGFYPQGGGQAELKYTTPSSYRILLVAQITLWSLFLFLVSWVARREKRNRQIRNQWT